MLVHTKENVFIANFNKEAFKHEKEILSEVNSIWKESYLRNGLIHNNVWDNYINNKILNKYITFTRIRK